MNQKQRRLLRTLWREIDALNEATAALKNAQERLGEVYPQKSPEWNERNQQVIQQRIDNELRRSSIHRATVDSLAQQLNLTVQITEGGYKLMQWNGEGGLKEMKR